MTLLLPLLEEALPAFRWALTQEDSEGSQIMSARKSPRFRPEFTQAS